MGAQFRSATDFRPSSKPSSGNSLALFAWEESGGICVERGLSGGDVGGEEGVEESEGGLVLGGHRVNPENES